MTSPDQKMDRSPVICMSVTGPCLFRAFGNGVLQGVFWGDNPECFLQMSTGGSTITWITPVMGYRSLSTKEEYVEHLILIVGTADGSFRKIHPETGAILEDYYSDEELTCSSEWQPKSDEFYVGTKSGNILMYNVSSGSSHTHPISYFLSETMTSEITCLKLHHFTAPALIVGSLDRNPVIFNRDTGLVMWEMAGFPSPTTCIATFANKIYCGTGSSIVTMDYRNQRLLGVHTLSSPVHSLRRPSENKTDLLIGCASEVILMNCKGHPALHGLAEVPFIEEQDKLTCMVASGSKYFMGALSGQIFYGEIEDPAPGDGDLLPGQEGGDGN